MRGTEDRVGITATVPSEVIYAAGLRPVDLNNVFIGGHDPMADIRMAEAHGFPANTCNWIKGCYAAAHREGIRTIVAVSQGDCANTHALAEILLSEGVRVIPFAFPCPRDRTALRASLAAFAREFGVTLEAAEAAKARLDAARAVVHAIDDLTWRTGQVTGGENFSWTIATSDFEGDPEGFARRAEEFLSKARARAPRAAPAGPVPISNESKCELASRWGRDSARPGVRAAVSRLGLIGIPPIAADLHEALEAGSAAVLFNEFPWQFTMPYAARDLVDAYHAYTYPYDVFYRIERIREQAGRRGLTALVHYVQSFCFRHIQDRLIRERLDMPILTLEVDRPGPLDGRSRTRIEAFLEGLADRAAERASGVGH